MLPLLESYIWYEKQFGMVCSSSDLTTSTASVGLTGSDT
jgi:hypothetical protein